MQKQLRHLFQRFRHYFFNW